MARASALLAQGSIGAARIVLERAAETGSAEANFMLAETYDPIVLSKWGTYGTRGEPTKARELYTKAEVGGIREAKDRTRRVAPVMGFDLDAWALGDDGGRSGKINLTHRGSFDDHVV